MEALRKKVIGHSVGEGFKAKVEIDEHDCFIVEEELCVFLYIDCVLGEMLKREHSCLILRRRRLSF